MKRNKRIVGLVIIVLFALLAGLSRLVATFHPLDNRQEVKGEAQSLVAVTRVIDGDTILVNIDGKDEKVRLIGIDTPEIAHGNTKTECFGQEAKRKSLEILTGKMVRLESDESQSNRDKYNRLLRYVFLADGTLVNKLLVEQGFAFEYTYDIPYQYQREFKEAQVTAKKEEKGLWSQSACP